MQSVRKPWWQQATAIVSLGAGGAVTGLSFVPGTTAEVKSPSNMLIRLLAQEKPAQPAAAPDDATLRSTIVNVANYYLRMAAGKTPAEMEAIIWQHDSVDGADHGESCAAFASLTLELAAQAVGQQSWVTGGSSYPWPLEEWADVRVDPNPASLGITSVLQDAQAHHRWHPLGDGYEPLPGDWVLFHGHVEVVTQFSGGVLHTVGGDSLPNFTVNAHEFSDPLGAQGVVGFVNNGALPGPASKPPPHPGHASAGHQAGGSQAAGSQATTVQADQGQSAIPGAPTAVSARPARARSSAEAAIPGMPGPAARASSSSSSSPAASSASPDKPSARRQPTPPAAPLGESAIPGLPTTAPSPSTAPATAAAAPSTKAPSTAPHPGSQPPSPVAAAPELGTEQAFISEIAAGAIAAQHRYGVPASVTIAQAIDESAWGQSGLATRDHNLFGIKGSGPAGSDPQPTHEYENGQSVTRTALFRVYHDAAESIDDHGKLLATSGYYRRAMADRQDPNAFADALTGVYATDPGYGTKLIGLMQQYDLYRYDNAALTATARAPRAGAPVAAPRARKSGATSRAARPGRAGPAAAGPGGAAIPGVPPASPVAAAGPPPPTPTPTPTPAPTRAPKPTRAAKPTRAPGPTPAPTRAATPTRTPGPTRTAAPTPTRPPAPRRQTDAYQASAYQASPAGMTAAETMFARSAPTRSSRQAPRPAGRPARAARTTRTTRAARTAAGLYQPHVPPAVWSAFNTTAKARLLGEEPLYRDVASVSGIRWELLAACDWMQCEARSRYSPVHGEKLCTVNRDGTVYRTKSEALEQCAEDLAELTWEVYRIDLTAGGNLSIRDLASAFAAFRWGGLLKLHHTSAMEFPYSVAGLTDQHVGMRWPNIAEPNTPDKPGSRFRMRFGAVPIVLGLSYPATV